MRDFQGNFDEAYDMIQRSINIYEALDSKNELVESLGRLSSIQ